MAEFATWLKEVRGLSTKSVDTYVSCIQRITRLYPNPDPQLVQDFIESAGTSRYVLSTAWRCYKAWGDLAGKVVPFKEKADLLPNVPLEVTKALHTLRFGRDDGTTLPVKASVFPVMFAHTLSTRLGTSTTRQIPVPENGGSAFLTLDAPAVDVLMKWNGYDGSKDFPLVPEQAGSKVPMSEQQITALLKAYREGKLVKASFGVFTPFHEWLLAVRERKVEEATKLTEVVGRVYATLGCPSPQERAAYALQDENRKDISRIHTGWTNLEQYAHVRAQRTDGPSWAAVLAAVDVCLHGTPDGDVEPLPNLRAITHEQVENYPLHAPYLRVIAAGARTGWLPKAPICAFPGQLVPMELP